MSKSELLFSATIAAIYLISCTRELSPENNEEFLKKGIQINSNFGGKYKFLTILNLYAQTGYFIICFLNALYEILSGAKGQQTGLRKLCNFLYTTLIFPFGTIVTVKFWTIYLINRELIFPKVLDELIPPWHNHISHTLPLVAVIGENFITKHTYKDSLFWGALPTVTYAICYLIWILIVAHFGGFWVYPILNVLEPVYRTVFIIFSIAILIGFYQLGNMLNATIWPVQQEDTKKSK